MCITLNLVLESLSQYEHKEYIEKEKEIRFSRLCLLPEKQKEIDPERLYVGTLQDALSFRSQGVPFYCVCVCDAEEKKHTNLSGLIVIYEKVSPYKIFSELQDLFYSIQTWVSEMNRYAYEKKPLQDMLELCEPVIGNFIAISDSALSLVCYTRHIPTDDPVSRKLLENGFHPEESVEAFRNLGLFEQWNHAEGLIINRDHIFSRYDVCSKVFRLHNTYYIHAVMICSARPLSPGLMDLFRMLTNIIELYVTQDWKEHSFLRNDHDRFLIELIEGRAGSTSVIEARAKQIQLPLNQCYQLCLIEFSTFDQLPIGSFRNTLSGKYPESRITVYQNRLLMLFSSYSDQEGSLTPKESLGKWMEKADARCAISSIFSSLPEVAAAYEQTRLIFLYYPQIKKQPFAQLESSRIVEFDRCFQMVLLGESPAGSAMWKMTRCHRMLKKIHAYDENHGTNNLHLLYTYLFCDCSATETGKQLHMHRNNVLYRISRIEELMEMKVSDPGFRYELFCGCAFLQLYGV